jgi:hypothetical protein
MAKDINVQTQEAEQTPNSIHFLKIPIIGKFLKATRQKWHLRNRGKKNLSECGFLIRHGRKKKKVAQHFSSAERYICPVKIAFKNEGEIKTFLDEERLRFSHQHTYPKRAVKEFL